MTTCKSCGAEIRYLKTAAGNTMPVDVEPVEDGNIIVHGENCTIITKAEVASRVELGDATPRFKSHFATCPQATHWRKS